MQRITRSRRLFLETGIKASVVASIATVTERGLVSTAFALPEQPRGLTQQQQLLLRAVMDEMIPAGDGMPAASEVGGVEYLAELATKAPSLGEELQKSLSALVTVTSKQFARDFSALPQDKRIAVLRDLEKSDSEAFGNLKGYVCESYYTQPTIWKLIGYDVHGTEGSTSGLEIFDETLLTKVKTMAAFYRNVG